MFLGYNSGMKLALWNFDTDQKRIQYMMLRRRRVPFCGQQHIPCIV
jgi:hypothetical protein